MGSKFLKNEHVILQTYFFHGLMRRKNIDHQVTRSACEQVSSKSSNRKLPTSELSRLTRNTK